MLNRKEDEELRRMWVKGAKFPELLCPLANKTLKTMCSRA